MGGTEFTTRRETLRQIPYFAALFSSNLAIPSFIDRDPEAFHSILNHARDHRYRIPAKYHPDADYFGYTVTIADMPVLENAAFCGYSKYSYKSILPEGKSFTVDVDINVFYFLSFKSNDGEQCCIKSVTVHSCNTEFRTISPEKIKLFRLCLLRGNLGSWLDHQALMDDLTMLPLPIEVFTGEKQLTITVNFIGEVVGEKTKLIPFAKDLFPFYAKDHYPIYAAVFGLSLNTMPIGKLSGVDTLVCAMRAVTAGFECEEYIIVCNEETLGAIQKEGNFTKEEALVFIRRERLIGYNPNHAARSIYI